jgi:hypothetical protein
MLQCTPSHHDKTNTIDDPRPYRPIKIAAQGASINSAPAR